MQIASRISPQMKFGPLSKPFLQVPVMSLAQKVVVSDLGHEPNFEGRQEQGADLYSAMLNDTGQPALVECSQQSERILHVVAGHMEADIGILTWSVRTMRI